MMLIPNSFSCLINANGGSVAPDTNLKFSNFGSCSIFLKTSSNGIKMAGAPAAAVTFSLVKILARLSGVYLPGRTILDPIIVAEK